jgi:hypothetical protein
VRAPVDVTATVPGPGDTASPDTPVVVSLRLAPGGGVEGVRMALDGEDVTARCLTRTDLVHPPRRADLVLAGPLAPGDHEAVVRWTADDGAPREHAWRFSVA